MRTLLLLPLAAAASGCIAKTVVDVVTLPVRAAVAVVSEGIDAATTTQAEADRAAGRRLREEDERLGREAREAARRARAAGEQDPDGEQPDRR
jgi:hypothetical protein